MIHERATDSEVREHSRPFEPDIRDRTCRRARANSGFGARGAGVAAPRPRWYRRAQRGLIANGRRYARFAVGADLDRAPCRRNGARRRGGEDPGQLDRGAVRLDAAPSREARADEEQRQELRLRTDALPRHARGHHRAGEQRDRTRQPRLFLARARDRECGVGGFAHRRRPVQGRNRRPLQQPILRAQGQPDPEGRGPQRQDRRDQCGRQRRRHRDARHAAQARARGQTRLYRGGGAVPDHEGHAKPEKKADLASFVAPFSFDPELKQIARPLFSQRDALGATQMIVWVARTGFLQKNRAAMVDFMEDSVRVVRWYLDPKNHDEAVQIAAKITKLRPELFVGWLFTNKEYSRSPDLLPDLAALQSNIDVQRDLGFLKRPIDVQTYADLSIVREAAQRLK